MGLRINQNISAMNAARNLRSTNQAMSKSLERLSSGYRINRAADDPAGMIISENLRAQIAGLGQAIKNSDNAVNVIKTSEAALDEVLKQLRSIRTLAIDALTTGSSDAVSRAADQVQIDSSIETIDRIGNTTQYGTIKLLNGSSGVKGSTNSDDLKFISGTSDTKASGSTGYGVEITQLATQGEKTFKINNEFGTTDDAMAGNFTLANANEVATYQVDFGASTLSATERAQLGAALKTGGLTDDTSQTGISVTFIEEQARAWVSIDSDSLEGGAANTVTQDLLDKVNDSSIGSAVRLSGATAAREFNFTGRYAGLDFEVRDVSFQTNGTLNTTANSAKLTAAAAIAGGDTNSQYKFVIDFASDITSVAGKESMAKALKAGGLQSVAATDVDGGGGLAGLITTDLSDSGVTAGQVSINVNRNGGALSNAQIAAALNETTAGLATKSNINRFVLFSLTGANIIEVITRTRATFDDAAAPANSQAAGFTTQVNQAGSAAGLGAGETSTLAGNSRGASGLGTDNAVTISEVKTVGELLTINESSVVNIASGTALTSVVSRIRSVIEADDLDLTVTFTPDTKNAAGGGSDTVSENLLTFKNTKFGSAKNDIKSTRGGTLVHHLGVGTEPFNLQGKDVAGTINTVQAAGDGQFLTLTSKGDNADGVKLKFIGKTLPTVGSLKSFNLQGSLLFQIGPNAGQTVTQAINDIRARKLGTLATGLLTTAQSVSDINVLTSDGATDALNLVDNAITDITTLRGKLGAFQMNILESNINSLGVAQESLASAESVIRDADFADETVSFTRTQILLQAGTAILTQANAIPQAVLQLLA